MQSHEPPEDTAVLVALDFPTPEISPALPFLGAQRRRAAAAAVGVVILSLLMLALIVTQPLLPALVRLSLATFWTIAFCATTYRLVRVGTYPEVQ